MSTNKANTEGVAISPKIVNMHIIFVFIVCLGFGILNVFTGNSLIGILTISIGTAISIFSFFAKNKLGSKTMGFILSIFQLIMILVMSVAKHEMNDMFPLMLASLVISAVYFNKACIITHWVIMDLVSVIGFIFNDFFYGGESLATLIKGFAGINVGAVILMYLVKCCMGFIDNANRAKNEADALLETVQEQMNETEKLAEQQSSVVEQIAVVSATLTSSGEQMRSVSDAIKLAADKQQCAIEEISCEITEITDETHDSLEAAKNASSAASNSTVLLNDSNEEMKKMITAMEEIEDSSAKIQDIVSAIEDIAFQTNILALNASIEAARAGAAGKGFAVVADEVRNLAGKSQEAVHNTAQLINASMEAVQRGKKVADIVAQRMDTVIATAEESATHADSIAKLTERQAAALDAVKERIEQISEIIAENSQTAEESASIANAVADDTRKMDDIVKEFREE